MLYKLSDKFLYLSHTRMEVFDSQKPLECNCGTKPDLATNLISKEQEKLHHIEYHYVCPYCGMRNRYSPLSEGDALNEWNVMLGLQNFHKENE